MLTGSVFNTHDVAEEGDGHHWWTVPCWSHALARLFTNKKVSLCLNNWDFLSAVDCQWFHAVGWVTRCMSSL